MTSTWKIADLRENPHQDEIYGALSEIELAALATDIDKHGLRHPIEITESGVIIDGHQRVQVCSQLGWDEIEVVIYEALSSDELKERFIRANLTRRQLDPIGKARAIKALSELEQTRKGIPLQASTFREHLAAQLGGGISGRTVDRYLQLLTLPMPVQDAVSQGFLPMTQALKLTQLPKATREEVAARIAAGESPKSVVLGYMPKQKPSAESHEETPTDHYQMLLDFLGELIDELNEHAPELPGTAMPHGEAVDLLNQAIQFCERMRNLEHDAKQHSLQRLRETVGFKPTQSGFRPS